MIKSKINPKENYKIKRVRTQSIKREKDQENIQNIKKSQEDMIKSKINPKNIKKNITEQDF